MGKAHPITILQKFYKKFAFLLIPTVRGMYFLIRNNGGFKEWLSGVWIDVLLLLILIIIAIYNWKNIRYSIGKNVIYLKKGVLFKSEKNIKRNNITTITYHRPVFFRFINAVNIFIDTEGGGTNHSDMYVTISAAKKTEILATDGYSKIYSPKLHEILFFSFCVTDAVASTIYTVLLINRMGKIIGLNILTEFISFLSKATEYLIFAVIIVQGLGIMRNFLYYSKFFVRRSDTCLYFENGFFSKTKSVCKIETVNFLDRRQNLISFFLGLDMAFVQCTGYGKVRKKEALLIPAGTKSTVDTCIKMLLPEFQKAEAKTFSVKPSNKAFLRYVRLPLIVCGIIITLGIGAICMIIEPHFAEWLQLAKFSVFMAVVPFVLFAIVRTVAFKKAGIFGITSRDEYAKNFITICYYKGLNIHTVSFYSDKISHISVRQSIFQRKNKTCDIIICTGGDGGYKHKVTGLYYDKEFLFSFFS